MRAHEFLEKKKPFKTLSASNPGREPSTQLFDIDRNLSHEPHPLQSSSSSVSLLRSFLTPLSSFPSSPQPDPAPLSAVALIAQMGKPRHTGLCQESLHPHPCDVYIYFPSLFTAFCETQVTQTLVLVPQGNSGSPDQELATGQDFFLLFS